MKKLFVGFLAVALIVMGACELFAHSQPTPASGSTVSPDIQGPYYSVNGLQVFKYHVQMATNASTTCSILSPSATSTLTFLAFNVASSSSNATIWEVGTDPSSAYATTTLIGTKFSIAAGGTASWIASTTASTGSPIYGPKTYVNLKVGSPGVGYPRGFCDATFTVL